MSILLVPFPLILVLVLLDSGLGHELLKDEVVAFFFGGSLGLQRTKGSDRAIFDGVACIRC